MALFQKKPQIMSSVPLYSVGADKTIALIGLGNIGKKYDGTRHNIGFSCIDTFVATHDFPKWEPSKKFHGDITKHHLGNNKVIALKPATLMNRSGQAVKELLRYNALTAADCIVLHDDLDIEFGKIKSQIDGSAAGHNGIKSLMNDIGSEFGRIRVGIGPKQPPEIDSSDFVLGRFSKEEKKQLPIIEKEVVSLLTEQLFDSGQLRAETRTTLV